MTGEDEFVAALVKEAIALTRVLGYIKQARTDRGPAATAWSHGIDRALKPVRGVRTGTVTVNGPDAEHASLLPRPDPDSAVEGP
ncbi:hypothetical protein [Streptomyces sp. NPDC050982]|uniref:hypothetical protein n=1 Tax=Streptomyces sp. NPDC050982 TaxID=3154746 RepID=UPI0033CA8E58